ncbi:MAG: hypothetical protein KAV87_12925 [Desulfobacteraceae bacterium]|nr:hypothetical protein [Desulfobacteraceae bacterium]
MNNLLPRLDLRFSPTLSRYIANDWSDVKIMKGPVGSGKTTALCFDVMAIALRQEPSPNDNIRYTRPVILRNTYSELKTTTIQTWRENFPEDKFGPIGGTPPISQHIIIPPSVGEDGVMVPGINCEIFFLAIDKPADLRKLLSLNVSHIAWNEMREFQEEVILAGWDRVGRFPNRAEDKHGVECTNPCMIGDTNPPDEDHWLHEWEFGGPEDSGHGKTMKSLKFYNQPGAVIDVTDFDKAKIKEHLDGLEGEEEAETYLRQCNKAFVEEQGLENFYDPINSHGRKYIINPVAENIPNLPTKYYQKKVPFNNKDRVRVYYESKYGVVGQGKPVIPEYNDGLMSVEDLPVLKDADLIIGADVGGGTLAPSAVIGQRHPRGIVLIHAEVVCYDMGVEEFSNQIAQTMAELFPGRSLVKGWGDPAGAKRDEIFETVVFNHLISKGVPMKGAQTNAIGVRIEATKAPMLRLIDGKPGFMVNKRCKVLRAGLAGKWVFRRLQVAGTERYAEKPDKGKYSHVCDALGYFNLGTGEYQAIQGRQKRGDRKPIHVKTGWDPLA